MVQLRSGVGLPSCERSKQKGIAWEEALPSGREDGEKQGRMLERRSIRSELGGARKQMTKERGGQSPRKKEPTGSCVRNGRARFYGSLQNSIRHERGLKIFFRKGGVSDGGWGDSSTVHREPKPKITS